MLRMYNIQEKRVPHKDSAYEDTEDPLQDENEEKHSAEVRIREELIEESESERVWLRLGG